MKQFFTWREAFLNTDIPSTTKLVLLVISTYMNDHGGGAFPAQSTIAENASLSKKAVNKHINIAIEHGWITKSVLGLKGQQWRQYEYKIAFPNPTKNDQDNSEKNDKNNEGGERGTPPSKSVKVGNVVPKGGEPEGKRWCTSGQKVVNEVHTNTPKNSPYNSPINNTGARGRGDGCLEEDEFKKNNTKKDKGKRNGTDRKTNRCGITEIINIDEPIPKDFIDYATSVGLQDIKQCFIEWVRYWIGEAGRKAGREGWLAVWQNRVDLLIKRQNSEYRNQTGRSRNGAGSTLAATSEVMDEL